MTKSKPMKRGKKVKKPRDLKKAAIFTTHGNTFIMLLDGPIWSGKEARKLAAWLVKASDYLESKDGKKCTLSN